MADKTYILDLGWGMARLNVKGYYQNLELYIVSPASEVAPAQSIYITGKYVMDLMQFLSQHLTMPEYTQVKDSP